MPPIRITRDTLLPIGVVLALLGATVTGTWIVATERASVLHRIVATEQKTSENTQAIAAIRLDLNQIQIDTTYLAGAMKRIEEKLKTLP